MPVPAEWIRDWAQRSSSKGWLYHRVPLEQLLPWILRDGLLPRAATGMRGLHLSMPSRPTHIYFGTTNERHIFEHAGMGSGLAQIAVHVDTLDPQYLDSDEDKIGAYALSAPAAIRELPGARSLTWRHKNQPASEWAAANSAVIDQPDWVWYSLQQGAVAYRQAVPLTALCFHSEVRERWETAPHGVPAEVLKVDGHPYAKAR